MSRQVKTMVAESSLNNRRDNLSLNTRSEHGYGNSSNMINRSYSQRGPPTRTSSHCSIDSSLSSGSYHGSSARSNLPNNPMRSLSSHHSSMGMGYNQRSHNSNHSRRSSPRRHQSMGPLSHSHSTSSSNNNSFQNKSFRKPKLNRSPSSSYDPLGTGSNHSTRSFQHSYKKPELPQKNLYLAMDCEMVGTVTGKSVAARVVLIDWKGRPVFDKHMKPNDAVTDFRTFVSGITAEDLEEAPPFDEVVQEVKEALQDKILVGHGLDNDLRALGIDHAWLMMRDTAYYQPFMRQLETSTFHNPNMSQNNNGEPVWGPRKLKDLAKEKLQRDIQVPGKSHCPIEDAAAALDLYKSHRPRWEACMSTEERQQKQRQAYEQAVLAYEQYHAEVFATGVSRLPSGDDLSVSMHSYFPPSNDAITNTTANSQMNATAALHTGFHQPPGLSRHPSIGANSFHHGAGSNMSLDAHSYHGVGSFNHQHNLPGGSSSNSSRRLYERKTNLVLKPGPLQRQVSLDSYSPASSYDGYPLETHNEQSNYQEEVLAPLY